MAAKATVAKRTATTVTELVALLMPSRWSFLSSLAIPWTFLFVFLVCKSWMWTSFLIWVTVFLNSSRGWFSSLARTAPRRMRQARMSVDSSDRERPSAMSSAVLWSLVRALTLVSGRQSSSFTICKEVK